MMRDYCVKNLSMKRAGAPARLWRQRYLGWLVLLMLGFSACLPAADSVPDEKAERAIQDVALHFEQRVILPTSTLIFRVRNSDRMVAETASVTLTGGHSIQGQFQQTYRARLARRSEERRVGKECRSRWAQDQ